ncbi:type IV pilus modification protein PilV [Conchiformibius kuhniae]|uniref:Type IV pilus modification protein PilV n=1 Tax=Conchiformibius kuhniae TaxID=211502 RepID=A0A8T9MTG0_9NEIS|nr:type IV pilus modification protein PilV [Conchiformibius kuhniae]UOP05170.1 type IV pilus modification protein PilV [Conchiformibius kuhniae]
MKPVSARIRALPRQQGATLIEVMVSVFLLTFGVLGLMAAQIRSVSSISEAESRSTIAQAAENLAEAMQANPQIVKSGTRAVRNYTHYLNAGNTAKELDLNADPGQIPNPLWGTWDAPAKETQSGITKENLAASHIALFEYMLRQTPNAQTLSYVVCTDNPVPSEPTVNGTTVNFNCSNRGSTVIKVAWTNRPADAKSQTEPVYYSYQLQLAE